MRIDEKSLEIACELLLRGEVIAFPTETVFGLGVIFDDEKAFNKLVKVKQRPNGKPFTIMCKDITQIENIAFLDDKIRKIINNFMPGELTLLLKPKNTFYPWTIGNSTKIGVRIPNNPLALKLLKMVNKPLLVPSANKAGQPPCLTIEEVENVFDGEIAGIVLGKCGQNPPSTIIDLSEGTLKLIREGNISLNEIKMRWN